MADVVRMTEAEWRAEGARLFGADTNEWRFRCPCCGYVAAVKEWHAAGASSAAAFSCIGRWTGAKREALAGSDQPAGPCNYAGGGLFRLNPVIVTSPDGTEHQVFAFAVPEGAHGTAAR